MGYPSKWTGSTDPADASGVASFIMDGVDYALRLDSFTSYQMLTGMLDVAFRQGRRFAAQAMRSHINTAMDVAERTHAP